MRTSRKNEPSIPTPEEAKVAADALKGFASCGGRRDAVQIELRTSSGVKQTVTIPASAVRLLVEILGLLASGQAVAVSAFRKELTTKQAADLLNVSPSFMTQLMDKGEMPFRVIGGNRRIPLAALLKYKRKTSSAREEALDFLAQQAQELKLGY